MEPPLSVLIADLDKSIAKSYDVLLDAGIALRGLFIIDPKGTVRHSTINDLPVGRNVDEALRVISAFQYVEEHGEVCPANWKKCDKGMTASPEGVAKYLAENASKL